MDPRRGFALRTPPTTTRFHNPKKIFTSIIRPSPPPGTADPAALSPGFLFYDFFRYFGHEYRAGPITVRNTTGFVANNFAGGSEYLVVDNPFEIGKDVANVEVAMIPKIRQEFRRAASVLLQGGSFAKLVEGAEGLGGAGEFGGLAGGLGGLAGGLGGLAGGSTKCF